MKEKLSVLYKILIVIVSGIGLYLNFNLLGIKALAYFTVQSNLAVFVYYLFLLIKNKLCNTNEKNYFMKSIINMAVTFTMIGYALMYFKNGTAQVYIGHEIASIFSHVLTPLLVVADYFIYDEKGYVKKIYPFIWSMLLVAYIIFDNIFTSIGGVYSNGQNYPYSFLDNNLYGNVGVKINCFIIYISCILFGFLIHQIDRRLHKKTEGRGK